MPASFGAPPVAPIRGWLSQATRNLILETVRRFGAPGEPIIVRQNQQEKTMGYDNTNGGALFKNDDKKSEKSPDYFGPLNIAGTDYYVSGWIKTSKNGVRSL